MSQKQISRPVHPLWAERPSEVEQTPETTISNQTATPQTPAQVRIASWLARRKRSVRP